MAQKKKIDNTPVNIMRTTRGEFTCCLVSTSPMLHNRLSQKAMRELLLPSGPKTAADKKMSLKHEVDQEYRDSPYVNSDSKGATYLQHLSSAFRGAMRTAALDLPGITKAEVGRMVWVVGDRVDIYGVPQLDMRIVRQAGQNRAPDVRTRVIVPEWACKITVSYQIPQMRQEGVLNLLASAGISIGVGDYRNEKGAGNYGLWEIVTKDDSRFKAIVKHGGRKVQLSAMKDPTFYNDETEDLYSWYVEAVKKHRTFASPAASKKNGKRTRAQKNGTRAQA